MGLFTDCLLFFGEEGLDVFALGLQSTAVFQETIVVSVGIEGLEDVVCDTADNRVDLAPVVKGLVLLLVKVLYFLVVHVLQLVLALAVPLELIALDRVYELVLKLLPPLVLHGLVGDILEAEDSRLGSVGVVVILVV